MSLTAEDLHLIDRARELATISGDAAKERTGTTDLAAAYAIVFGEARHLLSELAATAERLGGNTGDLDAIRGILAGFDWEHDDHQYALEQIEMIADKGQP